VKIFIRLTTEGENPHLSNYRGCSHAKDLLQRKAQNALVNHLPGRMSSTRYTTPAISFAAALQAHHNKCTETTHHSEVVHTPGVHSVSLDETFKVSTAVQQIMSQINGALVTATRIVIKLLKHNGR
jgi:hypothetical protein